MSGAVFETYADEDITTPDGTVRYKKDTFVDTITTDKKGTATSKQLYLGKYRVVETVAPYGTVINPEPHTVELTYSGQNEKVTNTSTSFTNDRQKAEINLTKILEQNEKFNIGSNDEILNVSFGLYADEDLKAANGSVIPKDGLLEIITCNEKVRQPLQPTFRLEVTMLRKSALTATISYLIKNTPLYLNTQDRIQQLFIFR